MKKTRLIIVSVAALTVFSQSGLAQDARVWNDPRGWWSDHFVRSSSGDKYLANEFTMDLFASYVAGQRKFSDLFETNIRSGRWGGGVGLNYFITREIGIGTDVNIPDNGGNFIDVVNASVIARFPFETSGLAPYIFGGAGRQTEPRWDWAAHAGVGLEYRMNPITGIFVDGRYNWADNNSDTLLLRTGLRLAF